MKKINVQFQFNSIRKLVNSNSIPIHLKIHFQFQFNSVYKLVNSNSSYDRYSMWRYPENTHVMSTLKTGGFYGDMETWVRKPHNFPVQSRRVSGDVETWCEEHVVYTLVNRVG